jgi:nucleotidyltransferase/DNA polymerase involved in DNA repair
MCSMIVCVLVPRFELLSAAVDRELLLRPAALAPEAGREQTIGEVSGAAEGFGVRPGMRLGEALGRCPELVLVPPDPDRAESAWEELLARLEGIGAEVESGRPGEAFFAEDGLRDLWGGHLEGVMARARRAVRVSARLGAGPTRFCAYAAAVQARPRRRRRSRGGRRAQGPTIIREGTGGSFLAPLPVELLRRRLEEGSRLPGTLTRLGIRSLGELAALPRGAVAGRFGVEGLWAWTLACGGDEPLRPRLPREGLCEGLDLPEAASGPQLERALALLVDRLLAHPARRGRSVRRLRLAARLAGDGSWRVEVPLREASASGERILLALTPKLEALPGPARRLELIAVALGPCAHRQGSLVRDERERRRALLAEAIRQARAAGGRDAVLRVLEVDPDSRIPERRATLAPFPEPQGVE